MAKTIKGRVQHPVYTAAELKAKNPVLLKGEVVYESDMTLHKEKTAWNGKAAKDLSNVTLTKTFSQNGYYKAPDGLMFQWGRLGTAPSGRATPRVP